MIYGIRTGTLYRSIMDLITQRLRDRFNYDDPEQLKAAQDQVTMYQEILRDSSIDDLRALYQRLITNKQFI